MLLSTWRRPAPSRSLPSRRGPGEPARPALGRLRLEPLEDRLLLATFLVTTSADAGPGSLRQAILDANQEPGASTINFDIGKGGAQTIRPTSPLPSFTRPVVLNATTQPGFAGAPLIELTGGSTRAGTPGLTLLADHSTVRGLVINDFGIGIWLQVSGGDLIAGNYIGTDVTGTEARGNGTGVYIEYYSPNNTIGGTTAGARNLISGNTDSGVYIRGEGNLIQGNYIGTDVTGTAALGNRTGVRSLGYRDTIGGTTAGARNIIAANVYSGLQLGGSRDIVQGNYIGTDVTGTAALGNGLNGVGLDDSYNTIGGTAAGAGNLISGNAGSGVFIGFGSRNTLVCGNCIGADVTGTAALGNENGGVRIDGSSTNNTVGGITPGACNLISGNQGEGVYIQGGSNLVQGNRIGTDATGSQPLGNRTGVSVTGSNNSIGGAAEGAGNTIAYNGDDGVLVDSGTGNAVLGNAIFGNGGLGIRLLNGGNHDQPAPALTSATAEGGALTVAGTLQAGPSTTYTVELFASSAGQGGRFLGSLSVTTDADGLATFALTFAAGVEPGEFLTATATDPGNDTSMFSVPVEVTGP
jgi:titin